MKKLLSLILVISLAICFTACKKDKTSEPNTSEPSSEQSTPQESVENLDYTITTEKDEYSVNEDQTLFISANVVPNGNLIWTTSDDSVLSLNSAVGGVTILAKKAGVVTLTASCGNSSKTCQITVIPSSGEMIILENNQKDYAVEIGSSTSLDFGVYALSSDGTKTAVENANITYSLSNEKIASVENGAIKGVRHGVLQVNAYYEDLVSSASVTVYDKFISNSSEWLTMLSSAKMGEYYMLDSDIDFEGKTYTSYGADVKDDTTKAFRATLNGNGHTVKNITLTGKSGTYVSVFGKLYNAKISNLSIENVTVKGSNVKGGGIASVINGESSMIANVYLELTFEVTPENAGVIAYNYYGGTLNGILANVSTPIDNATSGKLSIIASIIGNVKASAVYVLAEEEITSVGELKGYSSLIDMAWDVNSERKFDSNYWTYAGGKELPTLNKK